MNKLQDNVEDILVDIVVAIIKNYKTIVIAMVALNLGLLVGSTLARGGSEAKAQETTQIYRVADFVNDTEQGQLVSLGDFVVTAYCPCAECCDKEDGITATGTEAMQGRTIAVDPDVIPYGTEVFINGHSFIAEDCGGLIEGNKIDISFNSHDDALKWGVQEFEVYAYA